MNEELKALAERELALMGEVQRLRKELAAANDERARLREALAAHNVVCGNGEIATIADDLMNAAGTLDCFVYANKEAEPNGILDCTDNDGFHYQSEFMSGLMDHARFGSASLKRWAVTLRAALTETGNG